MSVSVIASGVDTNEIRKSVSAADFIVLQGGVNCEIQPLECPDLGVLSESSGELNRAA